MTIMRTEFSHISRNKAKVEYISLLPCKNKQIICELEVLDFGSFDD